MADPGGGRLVGETISHYRVIALLGAGGMGVVYRGEDLRLGRRVAIKFVADDFANDPQAVARLRAEARAASALNHPNICTIYDIGTHEGHPFIVMELMEGQTLRDRLARGHLKVHELVDLGIEVADALQAAHSAAIMHRDIKPANVFLTHHGHVKLLDFGLAKTTATHPGPDSTTLKSGDLTAVGTTLGTVSYMSPEQATGDELDGRTDLFSLGVVLYEGATGHRPFEGKTHAVILSAILNRAPAPPMLLNQDLPVRLQDIIITCLEKDRELRYQNAADLRADLKRVRRDIESGRMHLSDTASLRTPGAPARESATGAVPGSGRSATGDRMTQGRSRMPFVAAAAIAAAVMLVVAGSYALWRQQEGATPTPASASASPPPGDVPAAAATPASDPAQSRLQLARATLAAGNYRAAQAYAAEILASDPNNSEALSIRQQSAAALERFDQALALTRQRLAAGDVQSAARALADARELDPTSPAVTELSAVLARRVRDSGVAAPAQGRSAREASPAPEPPRPTTPAPSHSADAAAVPPASPAPAPAPAPPPPAAGPAVAAPVPVAPPATADNTEPAGRPAERPAPTPPPAPAPDRSAPATPARPPASDDEAAVRRVVASYARAIENKDVSLFRSVKPNLSREEERRLQDGFRAVVSQQVQITPLSIDIHDQDATVTGQRRDVIDAGGRRQTVESRQTFRLARTSAGWVITDIR
jgi:serine/threonine protein kinase